MFDCAFVDLDDTLYNTRQFKEDIYNVFRPSGVSREDFLSAYQRAAEMGKFGYFAYSFEKQIESVRSLGASVPDDALSRLNALLGNNYLLDGANKFLAELKKRCNKMILLTAGSIEFQAKKIDAIGVAGRFDEIIQIPGGKDDVIDRYSGPDKKIVFINDNLEENRMIKSGFPSVEVLTILNISYWTASECEDSGIPWFRNLDEITAYLQNLIS